MVLEQLSSVYMVRSLVVSSGLRFDLVTRSSLETIVLGNGQGKVTAYSTFLGEKRSYSTVVCVAMYILRV